MHLNSPDNVIFFYLITIFPPVSQRLRSSAKKNGTGKNATSIDQRDCRLRAIWKKKKKNVNAINTRQHFIQFLCVNSSDKPQFLMMKMKMIWSALSGEMVVWMAHSHHSQSVSERTVYLVFYSFSFFFPLLRLNSFSFEFSHVCEWALSRQ